MQFKLNKLSLAIAAAMAAGASGNALALLPAAFNSTAGDTAEVYLSGASAQDKGLQNTIARICTPGTLDTYTFGSNQKAFFCSTTTTLIPGISKGKIVIYKSSVGGSGNGVAPLLSPFAALDFLQMSVIKANTTLCVPTNTIASITVTGDALGVPSIVNHTCASTSPGVVAAVHQPDGGLSDVEPAFFCDKDTTVLPTTGANAVTFGFAVTTNLYRALQAAQGKNSTTTTSDTSISTDTNVTGATIPLNDSEANMPSLGRDVIGSLFAGSIGSWSTIKTPAGVNLTGIPADANVYLARRVATSGTQKAAELFLYDGTPLETIATGACTSLPASCNLAATAMAQSPNGHAGGVGDVATACSTNPPPQTVFEGSGTGNVLTCLTDHNTNGRWAIGIASTEQGFASTNGWRFIKVDGQSPSMLNVFYNRYRDFVEQTIQKKQGGLTGDPDNTVTAVAAGLANPIVLRAVNQGLANPWGAGALFALPKNTTTLPLAAPTTMAAIQVTPVTKWTKAPSGATDNCKSATLALDTNFNPFSMPVPFPTAP